MTLLVREKIKLADINHPVPMSAAKMSVSSPYSKPLASGTLES